MDEIKKDESNTSRTIESKEPVNAITLTNFRYKRLLSDKKETKTVFLEGSFEGRPELAVLKLEKDSFQEEGLQKLFREENEIENSFSNDIYYSYRYHPKSDFNGWFLNILIL